MAHLLPAFPAVIKYAVVFLFLSPWYTQRQCGTMSDGFGINSPSLDLVCCWLGDCWGRSQRQDPVVWHPVDVCAFASLPKASFCVRYSLFIYTLPLWCISIATVFCTERSCSHILRVGKAYFHCRGQVSACARTNTITSYLISSQCLHSHDIRGQILKPLCICRSDPHIVLLEFFFFFSALVVSNNGRLMPRDP